MVLDMVREHRRVHPMMGSKKLYVLLKPDLERLGVKIGRDKLFDLLRSEGLLVKRKKKYVVTTQSFARYSKYEDLFNGKAWTTVDRAWVSDITYIRVGDTFRYLFLITDAYSRKIVGWYLGHTLETTWAVEALKMALRQCGHPKGLIHHSDRGFQYCSIAYTAILKKVKIKSSMGEAGNCYDNAMAERVNGILKTEYLLDSTFKNLNDAYTAVRHAVWAYNEKRPHMSLGMKKPEEVHKRLSKFSTHKRKSSPRQKPVKAI
ncbi:MAG: IS3 family transposase [Mongoliibacter sp.]|nr:MAG: IS3 family transposase [Mongoliibacter sp.]